MIFDYNFVKTIADYFISGGLIGIIITYYLNYRKEKSFDKKIINRLEYELSLNLATIVDNIYIIENNLSASLLGLIFTDIFNSLINSHKIVIIPKDAIDYLFCFYTEAKNVNNIIQEMDFPEALKRLKSAKYWLKKIYITLGKEQWYKENKLIGTTYKSTKEKPPVISDKKDIQSQV